MLCGGGVKKQAAEERSTQGQELSGQSCQSLHWLFSQHFDKQLKSSKLSLNSLQDCFQMALIFIFALSIIDVAFLSTKDHGHLFPQYENLDNPYNKIRLFSDNRGTQPLTQQQDQQHLCTSDIDCAVTARHTTGRPILTAPQLHSTPAASCNVIVICGELCWKILLLSFSFSWFLYFKDRKQASFEMLL